MRRLSAAALTLPAAALLVAALVAASPAGAVGGEPPDDPSVDPAACRAAAASGEAARVIDQCGKVIAAREVAKDDRVRALLVRAAAYASAQQADRALADYDDALRLEPKQPDALNARGELWLGKGERRQALADFAAALKLQPGHAAARANHKALALEVERLGARKALEGRPSFDCAHARRPVARAICADPVLAGLDRDVHAAYQRALRDRTERPAERTILKREQAAFLARRDASFGRPGYDLAAAMTARLQQLTGTGGR